MSDNKELKPTTSNTKKFCAIPLAELIATFPKELRGESPACSDDEAGDSSYNKTVSEKTRHSSSESKHSLQHSNVRKKSTRSRSATRFAIEKTPEVTAPSIISKSVHKTKSHSKTPRKTDWQKQAGYRDRVRRELFALNKPNYGTLSKPEVRAAPEPVPVPATASALTPTSVMKRPLNMSSMPTSYAATPPYPQSASGHNLKTLKSTTIKDKSYVFLKLIGMGGSSEVYKVLEISTSMEYAVKCVNLGIEQEQAQAYINEVRLLQKLQDSDRVIRLYDYEYDNMNQQLQIVLEAGETDLSTFLKARGAGLSPALVLHYWEEMLQAVLDIHEHGVVHADLKPANFLLVCGRLKLINFRIASTIISDSTSVVRAKATGTYSYMSPETLIGGAGRCGTWNYTLRTAPIKISFHSDVWSLGCILYSLVYERMPFGHIANPAKLTAILDPNHQIDYPPAEHFPPSLIAALKWCLTYNAQERPSVRQLLDIPYMQPASVPLPWQLLDQLEPLVTPYEFGLLKEQMHPEDDSDDDVDTDALFEMQL